MNDIEKAYNLIDQIMELARQLDTCEDDQGRLMGCFGSYDPQNTSCLEQIEDGSEFCQTCRQVKTRGLCRAAMYIYG